MCVYFNVHEISARSADFFCVGVIGRGGFAANVEGIIPRYVLINTRAKREKEDRGAGT